MSEPGPRRLPLASLRVFVAAAEHLSVSRAAEVLGVSAGAVSMQITALEEYLGAPLFRRKGRTVQLTLEGERLLPRVSAGLEQLEAAIDEARSHRRAGPLRVTMLASFLQQWLLPRLQDFHDKHPEIALQLHTSPEAVDFRNSDIQAGIRLGMGSWPGLYTVKLLDDWLVPVCTPQLFGKHGPVARREDLKRYRLLHSKSEPWRAWHDDNSTLADEWGQTGATFDDSVSVIRAAEANHGLALARWSLAVREIEAKRLVVASERIVRMQRSYFFVCPESYMELEKVMTFKEWVCDQAQKAPLPQLKA